MKKFLKILSQNQEVEVILEFPAVKNEKAEEALTDFLQELYLQSVLAAPVKISVDKNAKLH